MINKPNALAMTIAMIVDHGSSGDLVTVSKETLKKAGIPHDSEQYCAWLTEHKLRQRRVRAGEVYITKQ